jgi:hypothetical protein
MKDDRICSTCSMHGRNSYKTLVRESDGKTPLGRPKIDGRIILKWMLKNRV